MCHYVHRQSQAPLQVFSVKRLTASSDPAQEALLKHLSGAPFPPPAQTGRRRGEAACCWSGGLSDRGLARPCFQS